MAINGKTETLILPEDYSSGRITVYFEGHWEPSDILDARGTVDIPNGSKLHLDLSQVICDDLRRIRAVPSRLLANGISFSERKLERTDFRELSSICPHSVAITSCIGLRPEQLEQLGELRSLEHLNLTGTLLEPLDFSWLLQFSTLRSLFLSGTGANSTCIAFLSDLRLLEDLQLAECPLADRDVQAIWRCSSLRALNVGRCPITDAALKGIGYSRSLVSLSVPDTGISDGGIEVLVAEALRVGQKLQSLTLRSCRVTDRALVHLASLRSLTLIDLYGTEVTPEGASYLKKSLPECRIFVDRDKRGDSWKVGHQAD